MNRKTKVDSDFWKVGKSEPEALDFDAVPSHHDSITGIFKELHEILYDILEKTEMYCSEFLYSEGKSNDFYFRIAERSTNALVGTLVISPLDPPLKEMGELLTHQYRWMPSGERACTTDLKASLRQSLETQWKRYKHKQEKPR